MSSETVSDERLAYMLDRQNAGFTSLTSAEFISILTELQSLRSKPVASGVEAERVPELLSALKHAVQWHDQLTDGDIARYKAVIASAEQGDGEAMSDPLAFFHANVDAWGASKWFERLRDAIKKQDAAVVAHDDIAFETYRSIAASSAMRLVRDFAQEVQNALDPPSQEDLPISAWEIEYTDGSAGLVFTEEEVEERVAELREGAVRKWFPLYASHPRQSMFPFANYQERVVSRYELDAIRELLLAGQGDDDGAQILPDLSEDMSTLAMVEKCLMLLEKRRDALSTLRAD